MPLLFPARGLAAASSPSLFHRPYHNELRGQSAARGGEAAPVVDGATRQSLLAAPFRALIPSAAHATVADAMPVDSPNGLQAGGGLFMTPVGSGAAAAVRQSRTRDDDLSASPFDEALSFGFAEKPRGPLSGAAEAVGEVLDG